MQVSYKQSLLNKGAKFNNPLTPVISALKFQSNISLPWIAHDPPCPAK